MKAVPEIVTAAPTPPLAGVKPVIVGAGITVKPAALVAVADGVTTWIAPLVAPDGTVVVIVEAFTTGGLPSQSLAASRAVPRSHAEVLDAVWPMQLLDLPLPVDRGGTYLYWHQAAQADPALEWLRRIIIHEMAKPD